MLRELVQEIQPTRGARGGVPLQGGSLERLGDSAAIEEAVADRVAKLVHAAHSLELAPQRRGAVIGDAEAPNPRAVEAVGWLVEGAAVPVEAEPAECSPTRHQDGELTLR